MAERRARGAELFTDAGISILGEQHAGRAATHRMPAWKVLVSLTGHSEVTTDAGTTRGRALLVPPGVTSVSSTTGAFVAVFVDSWRCAAPGGGVVDLGPRRGASWAEAARVALDDGGTASLRALAGETLDGARPPTAALAATVTPDTTAEQLAARAGVSTQHLRRLLRSELGTSYTELHRWARLRSAFTALGGTTIADAAARAGFADQPHFTRVARAMLGRTPGSVTRGRRAP